MFGMKLAWQFYSSAINNQLELANEPSLQNAKTD